MDADTKVAVIGSGSWGTAFGNALATKGLKVTLWARRPELADAIQGGHENPDYLPGVFLSPRLRAAHELEVAVEDAGVIVMAVPSQGFRDVTRQVAALADPSAPFVSLAKGLEIDSLKRMSEVVGEEAPGARVACLSGPNLAQEIAKGYPAASVVASNDPDTADGLQELFMSPIFRTYSSNDIRGVEISGVVKNVIAIATGIAEGLGFGDNTKATVITRGLAEMTRLGVKMGADSATFSGLAGVGDLICTCMSSLSRNHHVGLELGKGVKVADILKQMRQVAEGVRSSKAVQQLAEQHAIDLPICSGVFRVIHEGQEVTAMLSDLLRTVRVREAD
ncbi:MAG: NAD(P)H-dependent glycerol-3-phosphate dehydrogenase [Actinomycetota bacterium]